MVKQGHNWVISASGGVNIRPGEIVSQARESSAPAEARAKARIAGKVQLVLELSQAVVTMKTVACTSSGAR